METKEFLDGIFAVNKRIDLIMAELEALDETGKKYPFSQSVKSDLEKILTISLNSLNEYRMKVFEILSKVPDPTARCVLEYRYIALLKFEDIAKKLFYSTRQVLRYFNEGINYISEELKK